MEDELNKSTTGEWLDDLAWARDLAVRLVGEAFADDVLQEARVAAWNADGGQAALSRPWLRTVVKRFALQVMRSEDARKRREHSVAREETLPSPAELSERLEQQQRIAAAVAGLAEPYRSTVLLRFSEGVEPTEIARRQGIPAGTVRWRLKSALDQLRAALDEQHGGQRQAWMVGLAPLLRAPSHASVPPTVTGVGIVVGSLVMKKWLAAAAAVVFVSLGWQQWTALEVGLQPLAPGPEEGLELPTVAFTEQPPAAEPDARVAAPVGNEEQAGRVASTRQTPPAGWWLVGQVSGIPAGESGATTLEVAGSVAGMSKSLSASVRSDGSICVDLAKIFDATGLLPEQLRVTVRHPGKLSAVQTWDVNRDQRQAGFIPGERAVFTVELELTDPFGSVRGEVRVPEGVSATDVRVLLVPVAEQEPDPCDALDAQSCDESGRFTLTLAEPGRYHVIAHHRRQHLRPSFLALDAIAGVNQLPESIDLDEGAVLRGTATVNGGAPGFELELEVKNPRIESSYCSKSGGLRWFEGRYHESRRTWMTDAAGAFRVAGLAVGEHRLRVIRLGLDGDRVQFSHGPRVSTVASARAPDLSAAVNFEFHVALFECVAGHRALPGVRVKVAYGRGSTSTSTDRTGRIAVAYAADGPDSTVEFSSGFYETVTQPLERNLLAPEWQIIELPPIEGAGATLMLELDGDPLRNMERFSLQLLAPDQTPHSTLESWQTTSHKRSMGATQLSGIPAGKYRLTIQPDDPSNGPDSQYPDTASSVWSEVIDIQLKAREVRWLRIPLHVGGRLWLQATVPEDMEDGREGGVNCRVLAASGKIVESRWVTQSGLSTSSTTFGGLALGEDCFLDPPLPVGNYTLEIWAEIGDENVRQYPFAIASGEITRMHVDDPR